MYFGMKLYVYIYIFFRKGKHYLYIPAVDACMWLFKLTKQLVRLDLKRKISHTEKKKVYKFKHSIQREVFKNLYIIYIQIKVYIEALIITWFTFRRVIHTRRDIRTFQLNSPFPLWKVKINTVTLKSKC